MNTCRPRSARVAIGIAFLLAAAAAVPARAEDGVWYRDGQTWVQARRIATRSDGLRTLAVSHGNRPTRAAIGRRAVLQLSAAAPVTHLARTQRLRIVAPPAAHTAAASSDSALRTPEPAGSQAPALNPRLRIYLVEGLHDEDGLALAARLASVPGVESAIPDLYLERRTADFRVPPDDPRYRGQWYLSRLEIERVWRVSPGDPSTTAAVIDDGCDMLHPDLAPAMLEGVDLLDGDDDPSFTPGQPGNEHGTACAGIIAAVGDNGVGITGTCPRCTLRCVRLFDRKDSLVPISADIAAFNYVFETGAAVVSNSWGFAEPQPVVTTLRLAIQELLEQGRDGRGTLVVFAAGNENRRIDDDEIAAIPGVVNVGAVNNFDEAAPFSNYGRSLAITAPTGNLTTDISGEDGADPTDYTSLFGGTSSAAPVVAGVAALVMSAVPELDALEVGELLRSTARRAPFAVLDERGHDALYGYGIVDPVAALQAAGVEVPELPEPVADAGPGDAGSAEQPRAGRGDDSGCSVSGGPGGNRLIGLAALAAAGALGMRCSRRRRPPPR